jgi:DNA-binding CsgD family transcriptional regulator
MVISSEPSTAVDPPIDTRLALELGQQCFTADGRSDIEAIRSLTAHHPSEHYSPLWLWLDLLDGRRSLTAGNAERASETMTHATGVARMTTWRHPCAMPCAYLAIEAHLAAGKLDRATALVDELERIPCEACRWPPAVAMLGRARLAAVEAAGESDELFDRALSLFAELSMPVQHAQALIAYGSYLRRGGRPRDARLPLHRAVGLATLTGAKHLAAIAQAELAATAATRRRRRDHDRDQLTAQERRIAALAAEGLTNAQIATRLTVSAKTVEHHLRHVYVKLGIGSRRELIRRGPRGDLKIGRPPDANPSLAG